jgi:hypothetical protein
MAWLTQQNRLTQCFVYTTAALNSCGIRPDGAEIKQWILEELPLLKIPDPEEVDVVLAGFVADGVKFYGDPDALDRFMAHPLLGARGHKLGVATA